MDYLEDQDMTLDILETAVPHSWSGSNHSPRQKLNPTIRRSRIDSNGSENSTGSGKSQDSRNTKPGMKGPPISAPGSRVGSFRERPHTTAEIRRSPTPRKSQKATRTKTSALTSNHNLVRADERNGEAEFLGPRRNSMPNVSGNFLKVPSAEDRDSRLRRVRSFKTTSKGVVVNRGDSFKKKSTHSLMSTGSTITEARPQQSNSQQHLQPTSLPNNQFSQEPPATPTYYRVILMGAAGCGKSLMAKQFMTSDYVGGNDDSQGKMLVG